MTRDLHDLFAAAQDELTGPAGCDEPTVARVRRRVRTRRTVRATTRGSLAVVLVAAVGAAGYLGLRRPAGPPPAGPTSTPSSASPSPDPSRGETPNPSLSSVDVPGLGVLPQADAAVLASTTTGWALVGFETSTADGSTVTRQLLLASPAGTLYRLSTLPDGIVLSGGTWTPGATTATVLQSTGNVTVQARLDLLTGQQTMTPYVVVDGDAATNPARTRTVRADSQNDGATVTSGYVLVDVAAGRSTTRQWPDGLRCGPPAWLDDTSIVASCGTTTSGGNLGVVAAGDGPVRLVVSADTGAVVSRTALGTGTGWAGASGHTWSGGVVFAGWPVPTTAQLAAQPYRYGCAKQVYALSADGRQRQLAAVHEAADQGTLLQVDTVTGSLAYLDEHGGCEASGEARWFGTIDLTTGSTRVLIQAPSGVATTFDALGAG